MKDCETNSLITLEPKAVWKNFIEFCKVVPRISDQEIEASNFIRRFGEKLGLKTTVDEVGNVIIEKPATQGMEDRKKVILQSHLDMVTDKTPDSDHDFTKDPIEAYVDGEWVKAKNTTLGADNGVGIAAIMTVLEATEIEHGPIAGLFTVGEETSFTGAGALKPEMLNGDIILNLDTEQIGAIYIGSAGSIITHGEIPYSKESTPANTIAMKLEVKGLKGGHSGLDIHLGLGNANKLINEILWGAENFFDMRLANISGGSWVNVISTNAAATFVIPAEDLADFRDFIAEYIVAIKEDFSDIEPNLEITLEESEMPQFVFNLAAQDGVLNAVYNCPNGVVTWSRDMPGVVGTSTNLGVVRTESDIIRVVAYQRGFSGDLKLNTKDMVVGAFKLAGANIKYTHEAPGWKPNRDAKILEIAENIYSEALGEKPLVTAIHAALECSIFAMLLPEAEMISIGPTIEKAHSVDERINIKSVEQFWQMFLKLLKNIPTA